MKTAHNIAFSVNEIRKASFSEIGIHLQDDFVGLKFYEDDHRWPKIEQLISSLNLNDRITTEFSKSELASAKFLQMLPKWHCGYPEPSNDFGYMRKTYDLSQSCDECNLNLIQCAPFRLKKNPGLGKKSIFQLNWVFDEYFITVEAWERVFKAFEIGCRPVVLHKGDAKVENIVQLVIPNTIDLEIPDKFEVDVCYKCKQTKYLPNFIGFSPRPKTETSLHIFKSLQYFGSGGSAFQLIMVSAALHKEIQKSGIKGVTFKPCA